MAGGFSRRPSAGGAWSGSAAACRPAGAPWRRGSAWSAGAAWAGGAVASVSSSVSRAAAASLLRSCERYSLGRDGDDAAGQPAFERGQCPLLQRGRQRVRGGQVEGELGLRIAGVDMLPARPRRSGEPPGQLVGRDRRPAHDDIEAHRHRHRHRLGLSRRARSCRRFSPAADQRCSAAQASRPRLRQFGAGTGCTGPGRTIPGTSVVAQCPGLARPRPRSEQHERHGENSPGDRRVGGHRQGLRRPAARRRLDRHRGEQARYLVRRLDRPGDGCRRRGVRALRSRRRAGRQRPDRRDRHGRRMGAGRCRRVLGHRRGQGPAGDQLLGHAFASCRRYCRRCGPPAAAGSC